MSSTDEEVGFASALRAPVEPVGEGASENVASAWCDEGCHFAFHMRGGASIYVPICMLCKQIDWDDIEAQVARLLAGPASAGTLTRDLGDLVAETAAHDPEFAAAYERADAAQRLAEGDPSNASERGES